MTRTTASQIAGTEEGLAFNITHLLAWLFAGFLGGLVAGYRSVGRGLVTGFLVGVYTIAGVVALLYFTLASEGLAPADVFLFMSSLEQLMLLGLLALNIPVCMAGGALGDQFYREEGDSEDSTKHTLFGIPWWHWIWLLIFLPAVLVSDIVLSGHLFLLGLRLTWKQLITFDFSESLLLDLAPIIGFIATFYGLQNLLDALSVRTTLSTGARVAKAIWGIFLLLFLVSAVWRIASGLLRSALAAP